MSRLVLALVLVLVLVLGFSPGHAQQAEAPPPTRSEAQDYPDVTYWQAWHDERRQDILKAREAVAAQIEHAQKIGMSEDELARLRAVDQELEKSAGQLEAIIRYGVEHDELDRTRERFEKAKISLAEREVAFERECASPDPKYTDTDRRKALDELTAIGKTRDALRAKIRDAPKQTADTRHDREAALDEYLKLDPGAVDRETLQGAKRERLKLVLAYLDSYLEFLPERRAVWQERLALLSKEEKLQEARLNFIDGVLSGLQKRKTELDARKAALEQALVAKTRALAAAPPGTPEAAALAEELRVAGEELWLADTGRKTLDDMETLEKKIPSSRKKIEKFQAEAANSTENDPDVMAADLDRSRGFVESRAKEASAQADRAATLGRAFAEHAAANDRALAEAERSGDTARAARLRELGVAIERQRAETVKVEADLLQGQQDLLAETTKTLKIRERALEKASTQRSLFDRRSRRMSLDGFREAWATAREDAGAARAALGADDGPFAGRPRWFAYAAAGGAALATLLFIVTRRAIDAALRRLS